MHIFDFNSAILLPELCSVNLKGKTTQPVEYYLQGFYIPALKRAGRHVLYSLPDFDASQEQVSLDYSVVGSRDPIAKEIFGVDVDDVNNRFRDLWEKVVEFLRKHGSSSEDGRENNFFARTRVSSKLDGEDVEIELNFDAGNVQNLCAREVILCLNIQGLRVYSTSTGVKKADIQDCKVAFIVDLVEELDDHVHIDVATARISEVRTTFDKRYNVVLDKIKDRVKKC
ncbi:uncharacterized protein FOMMEDRAFT_31082 [Fomitiporia mediterranea MF3/22]|uniref:uncharacterized protein n=1 Tax=Fomitiporia mediterranea (strain MF3/22) TaxID=694068 RepID=UPI00044084FA|nr:uncharacterized protein FOMMEDRAFT_31082 [Fomitiporia mediterranea MF3/22]EJC99827.1 hypothetical protein FOMMEDRAFT_31082 [Fomitiporia mediterranea MF3/22]